MALKMTILVFALMLCSASAASEASVSEFSSMVSLKAMEKVFARTEQMHARSMSSIMKTMSSTKAWKVLEKNNLTSPALVELTSQVHGKQSNLRKGPVKGYAALDGARNLLNEMIFTSLKKYDEEIASCTDYYARECAGMEVLRGQIAASNYVAANSRSLILGAESTIEQCQKDIPKTTDELIEHKGKCKDELARARTRLAVVEGDIEVLTNILKMTECNSAFIQILKCQDPCTKKSFLMFKDDKLMDQVNQLQSASSHRLMKDAFTDLVPGIEGLRLASFLQQGALAPVAGGVSTANTTKFNNPPAPRTAVPRNPCTDPAGGAPTEAMVKKAGCQLPKNSTQCYKLQEKFLLIQSGIQDERDELENEINFMKHQCDEIKGTLESQIDDDQNMLTQNQHDLAEATEKEANAAEKARQTGRKNEQMDADLKRKMHSCSQNYINYETEQCALKKIRGELYKMNGSTTPFFQDCVVSVWDPEECSQECGGGEQKLSRNVLTHPENGAECLPLDAVRACNRRPCPVDCRLDTWKGWSKCSAQCGGGVQQRLRDVVVASKYGGKPCGSRSETRPCNNQACEKDCELGSWSPWSQCSKDCDGGTQKRQKFVTEEAEGAGNCPSRWARERLEYKQCNMQSCTLLAGAKTLTCNEKLDIVLLIDGSGSLGQRGWDAEIKAAKTFVSAFSGTGADTKFAVVLYSGPSTWRGVYKCFGKNKQKVNMETDCKIKSVNHFSKDLEDVKTQIQNLPYPKGSTLTSLALMRAAEELTLGRQDAKSIVVAITDGRPLSKRATYLASRYLRKHARLVWVPVTKNAPLKDIKKWATRRWEENVVKVDNFEALENPDTVSHVVANICPANMMAAQGGGQRTLAQRWNGNGQSGGR